MNKKTSFAIITLVILVVLGSVGAYFIYKSKHPSGNKPSTAQNIPQTPIYELSGTVKSVGDNSVIVETSLGTIEFAVTPQTTITNSQIKVTAAQMKSGKPFHPQTTALPGKTSDIKPGMSIIKITSKDNLLTTTKTNAEEIEYVTYDIPTTP